MPKVRALVRPQYARPRDAHAGARRHSTAHKKGQERETWDEGEYISALWARENLCITLVSHPRPSSLPYSSVESYTNKKERSHC
jgi:hypothetical protein